MQRLTLGLTAAAIMLISNVALGSGRSGRLFKPQIEALLADSKVPSVSIALIRDGKIVFTAAYGMQSAGVPATPKTLYARRSSPSIEFAMISDRTAVDA